MSSGKRRERSKAGAAGEAAMLCANEHKLMAGMGEPTETK